MKIIEGGVTTAKGFEAASTAAKIKYQDRTDMAMIYSQVPCECAGTFTTNVVKAACVKWDQQVVKSGAKAQAVIVNSGIANACTGAEGFGYCKDTADAAAEALGKIDAETAKEAKDNVWSSLDQLRTGPFGAGRHDAKEQIIEQMEEWKVKNSAC